MNRNELQRLAERYLNGTATTQERELLNQWYETIHDSEQLEIISIEGTEEETKNRILEKIRSKVTNEIRTGTSAVKPSAIVKRMSFSVAATAAVVFIVAGVLWGIKKTNNEAAVQGGRQVNIVAEKIVRINLPDGSAVWLNAHTIFKYPHNFTGKVREVQLIEGRAFFDVKHESNHPFIVKTRNLDITVLGTSFDVSTYEKEGTTKVSVISGKVGITRPGHDNEPAVMLLPRQQVILSETTDQLTKAVTPDPVINLWCKSPLVFDQENLDNVFKAIEKQYNTHIKVGDKKLLGEHISITLNNQRLDTIMEILSFTEHFNYQIANDSTVIIK
jgi:ferric-dicitrate binding protein FerR (iron transport regulator)